MEYYLNISQGILVLDLNDLGEFSILIWVISMRLLIYHPLDKSFTVASPALIFSARQSDKTNPSVYDLSVIAPVEWYVNIFMASDDTLIHSILDKKAASLTPSFEDNVRMGLRDVYAGAKRNNVRHVFLRSESPMSGYPIPSKTGDTLWN